MALLDVRGLVKWYGPRKVVDGVSFHVNAGEVVGLLGPNGAGKTTSFRMTTGQIVPNEGQVWFNGEEITSLPMFRRARLGMGYLSQEPSIFRKLSVEKNLIAILEALPRSRSLGRKLSRRERWERTDEALARFNLTHVRKNSAARCSGGEKRRLEIARCLVCEPLLILLDEPFAAVDPLTKEDIRHNIRALANTGIGILLTDHDVREVLKITDRSYLIKDGKVIAHGTPEEIKNNPVAVSAYLGNTFVDELRLAELTSRLAEETPLVLETASPPPPPPPAPVEAPVEPTVEPRPEREQTPPIRVDHEETVVPLPRFSAAPPSEPPPPPTSTITEPGRPILPATLFPTSSSSSGELSSTARSLLEHEKMRRLVELLVDNQRWQDAWHDLTQRGMDAVPVLLETLERREVKLRHLAFRLLEQITGESLVYQSDAPDDIRLKQVAYLRAKFERRRAG